MAIALSDPRIFYAAVPKAACSSVKAALAVIDPEFDDLDRALDTQALHRRYPTRRFRRWRFEEYEGWWRFTVVRDPVKRLMSVYTDRVVAKRDLHLSKGVREAGLPRDPDPDYFFQNLDSYRAAASRIRHHALPTRFFIGAAPARFERVFRTSELGELQAELRARSGTGVTIPRRNASAAKLSFDALVPATRDALRPFLAAEYALLQGFFDNPLT